MSGMVTGEAAEPGSSELKGKRRGRGSRSSPKAKTTSTTKSKHSKPAPGPAAALRSAEDADEGEATWLDDAARWATVGIFVVLTVFALHWGSFFLIPTTVAVAFGLTLGPLVDWMERRGVPPYVASALIVVVIAAVLYGLFLAFAIPLQEWSIRVPDVLDKARLLLFSLRGTLKRLQEISQSVQEAASPGAKPLEVTMSSTGLVTSYLSSAPALLGQVFIVLGAFYFFLANRSRLRSWLLLLPVSLGVRFRIARIFRDTEYYLSRYVAAIAIVNVGLGVATGIVMWVLGLPSPALWGALAAVLNFVPYLGPGLMTVIVAGVALVTFDEMWAVLIPPLAFLGLNVIESQFVTPAVIGQQLTLNPFLVFMTLAFWVWLWGPIGAFLAVPLLIFGIVTLVHSQSDGKDGGVATFGKPAARAQQNDRSGF